MLFFWVVIIGRANVGKSTLFNKLTQKKTAIVNNTPGVTRDRLFGQTEWLGRPVIVVDTGGLDFDNQNEIELQVKEQVQIAQNEADFIILVVDKQQGLTPQDQEIIQRVRRTGNAFFWPLTKWMIPSTKRIFLSFSNLG